MLFCRFKITGNKEERDKILKIIEDKNLSQDEIDLLVSGIKPSKKVNSFSFGESALVSWIKHAWLWWEIYGCDTLISVMLVFLFLFSMVIGISYCLLLYQGLQILK